MTTRFVAVSGANSVIGKVIVSVLESRGFQVIKLLRSGEDNEQSRFDLSQIQESLPMGIYGFIHVAWDWTADKTESRVRNIENLEPLLRDAKSRSINTVLLSTLSVNSRNFSNYGQLKYELENHFLKIGGSVVRSGIIWGSEISGILKTLKKIAKIPFFTPRLVPDTDFSFSEIHSVAVAIVDSLDFNKTITIVRDDFECSSEQILRELSINKKISIPLPLYVEALSRFLRFAEYLKIRLPFRRDSLNAFLPSVKEEDTVQIQKTGFELNDFKSWLEKS